MKIAVASLTVAVAVVIVSAAFWTHTLVTIVTNDRVTLGRLLEHGFGGIAKIEEQRTGNVVARAQGFARIVDDLVERDEALLRSLTSDADVTRCLAALRPSWQTCLDASNATRDVAHFQWLALVDRAGVVLAWIKKPSEDAHAGEITRLPVGVPGSSTRLSAMGGAGYALAVTAPFPSLRASGVVLAGEIPLNEYLAFIDHMALRVRAWLFDADGRVMGPSDDTSPLAREVARRLNVAAGLAGPRRALVFDLQPGRWVVSDARVKRTGWRLAVASDLSRSTIYRVATSLGHYMAFGLVMVAGAAAIGLLVARRLTRQLRELEAVAERLGRGDFSSPVAVASRGDVGRLAWSFEAMRLDLRDSYALLDRRVAERTRELEDKSLELELLNDRLRVTAAEALAAHRLKSEFVATMSHEIRTPLNGVLGLGRLIEAGIYGPVPATLQEPIGLILRRGADLLDLINEVLDLSKIQAGFMKLAPAEYSPKQLVEDVAASFQGRAREKGLCLLTTVEGAVPAAIGDEHRIRQVLMNLVGNAIKFTDAGEVSIGVRTEGDRLVYAVRDSGIGIAADDLPAIFESFRQVDGSMTRRYGGTGLGLAISKALVELHGGQICVESVPARGSTFEVRVPRVATTAVGA